MRQLIPRKRIDGILIARIWAFTPGRPMFVGYVRIVNDLVPFLVFGSITTTRADARRRPERAHWANAFVVIIHASSIFAYACILGRIVGVFHLYCAFVAFAIRIVTVAVQTIAHHP